MQWEEHSSLEACQLAGGGAGQEGGAGLRGADAGRPHQEPGGVTSLADNAWGSLKHLKIQVFSDSKHEKAVRGRLKSEVLELIGIHLVSCCVVSGYQALE